MKTVLTCRECDHKEISYSSNGLMNRIKMWNHVKRWHGSHNNTPSQVRTLIREDNEAKIAEEAYRLQSFY